MHHRVDQHAVGARCDGQVDVGKLGQHGHARVDDDQRELALFQCLFQAPVDDGVLLRQVGAKGHEAVGVLKVSVAARWAVRTKRALVARHGRGHAQRGVAVVVVAADLAAHQLAQGVELFGEQLTGGDDGKRIASVFSLDFLDFFGGLVQRRVPGAGLKRQMRLLAHQGLGAAARGVEQLGFQQPLDAQLAPIHIGAGMAPAGDDFALIIEADLNRATSRAVVARGVLPLLHVLDRNRDGLAVLATE